eukprot:gnl/TRDRNA2_/TRDRNA2_84212_c1_seq1.p1 gnl/TRDRNA2_/TRDRNA2_84212_c1~~gnl/TRDRNA2_/TRDRNA2_84212_c1_seq1.p1  ORF type:complete len:149 (-),score=20.13 gnl/TRDRNA2_/TRDRNA2_84212_c1_seq1:193-639(-)
METHGAQYNRIAESLGLRPGSARTATTVSSPAGERQDDSGFVEQHSAEEVESVVRLSISEVLGDSPYNVTAVDSWTDQILERSLKRIAAFGRPFKYIATCVISRQTGSMIDTAATAFWDTQSDSLSCTRLGNGSVDCIVTVYACRRDS